MNIIKFNQNLFKNASDITPDFIRSSISMSNLTNGEFKDNHIFFTLAYLNPLNFYEFTKRMNYEWDEKVISFLDFRTYPYFEYEIKFDDLFDLDPVLETLSSGNSLNLEILDEVILR